MNTFIHGFVCHTCLVIWRVFRALSLCYFVAYSLQKQNKDQTQEDGEMRLTQNWDMQARMIGNDKTVDYFKI